jgi:O-antigen ligase
LRRPDRRPAWIGAAALAGLVAILVLQGLAVTQSYLWAAPLICLLFVAVAVDIPVVPFVGAMLLIRVLTDDTGASNSRQSASVTLAALLAGVLILLAIGLFIRRQRGLKWIVIVALWLSFFSLVAVGTNGESLVSIREGIREASILAVAVIVANSNGRLNMPAVTRMVQVVAIIPALMAIDQLVTQSGVLINDEVRANASFSHPNSACLFFALAVIVSLWRYLNHGRNVLDLLLMIFFTIAAMATFSLGGLASLLAMCLTFGLLQRGGLGMKVGIWTATAVLVALFLASPLGSERVASESSTKFGSFATEASAESHSSLAWRFYKWETLLPEWEKSPLLGAGLGTTVTAEGESESRTAGVLPHNEYVRYLVETGALGLITLLVGVGVLIQKLRLRRFTVSDPGKLGIAIVVGLLIDALASNTLLYTPAAYAAALVIGAVLCTRPGRTPGPTVKAA